MCAKYRHDADVNSLCKYNCSAVCTCPSCPTPLLCPKPCSIEFYIHFQNSCIQYFTCHTTDSEYQAVYSNVTILTMTSSTHKITRVGSSTKIVQLRYAFNTNLRHSNTWWNLNLYIWFFRNRLISKQNCKSISRNAVCPLHWVFLDQSPYFNVTWPCFSFQPNCQIYT